MIKMALDNVVPKRGEFFNFSVGCQDLKVPEPYEGRGNPTNDGPWFKGRVSVIENVAHHRIAGQCET